MTLQPIGGSRWGQGEAAVTVLYQPRIVREKRGEGWLTVWYQPMWM